MKKLVLSLFLSLTLIACSNSNNSDKSNVIILKENKLAKILQDVNFGWWNAFNDIYLMTYIAEGLEYNSDLKILDLKLNEFKKFVDYSNGERLPEVGIGLEYFASDNIPVPLPKEKALMLPLIANYEFDVWGKNSYKTKSAEKSFEAYKYKVKANYISFVSNIVNLYFNIVKLDKLIDIQREIVSIKMNIVDEVALKLQSELSTEVEFNKSEQELKLAQNTLDNLESNRNTLISQFYYLLGRQPEVDAKLPRIDFENLIYISDSVDSVPSDVIFSRPDVIAVEKEMEKANIDIKVARKEFLPTFEISGQLIWNNFLSGGFFSASNTIKSLLLGTKYNLFTGGRLDANLEISQLRYEQMLESYKKVSFYALKEINDIIYTMKNDIVINNRNIEVFKLEEKNFAKYQEQNANGLLSNIDLLKLKQVLLKSLADVVDSSVKVLVDNVDLYKATTGVKKEEIKNEK